MKLDVGCGGSEKFKIHKVRGDINCDILKPVYKIPNFVLCDAHHLPFKDEMFDQVTMFDVIEHLQSPFNALKEAWRVLKPGGILLLGTPNALYLPKIVRSAIKGYYSPYKDHIQTWGKPELENLLSNVGFNPITVKYKTYLDDKKPPHYELLIRICPFPALKHRQLFCIAHKPKF